MKDYDLIEHTADIGIKVRGRDLEGVFTKAAEAMFDIIAESCKQCDKSRELSVKIEAQDREELVINWLNELLSLSETKEMIFSRFQIVNFSESALEATIVGCPREYCKIKTEIKAATYHELKIEETKQGFQAQVIFDV